MSNKTSTCFYCEGKGTILLKTEKNLMDYFLYSDFVFLKDMLAEGLRYKKQHRVICPICKGKV